VHLRDVCVCGAQGQAEAKVGHLGHQPQALPNQRASLAAVAALAAVRPATPSTARCCRCWLLGRQWQPGCGALEQHIRGLEVTMQQVLAVEVDHRTRHIMGEEQHTLQGGQPCGPVNQELVVQGCA